jgi:exodeoxyribonuclease VII small subunit
MADELKPLRLETRLHRLEAIVAALEGDELELEAALALFEEGIAHLRVAETELKQTELRIEHLLDETRGAAGESSG